MSNLLQPIVMITVQGGLIDDLKATIPMQVVIEDWDIPNEETGRRPTRSVWTLTGDLGESTAEKLRLLIDNE